MPADEATHAIRDGNYPIVYVTGKYGGLYKYFPDSHEIHLMKGIVGGEQGHMVGYAGLNYVIPVQGILEIVLLPVVPQGGTPDAHDRIHHFVPGNDWAAKMPPEAKRDWTGISISPHDPNKWIIWANYARAPGDQCVYVTDNNGDTWTRVAMGGATSVGAYGEQSFPRFEWSRHTPDFVWGLCSVKVGSVEYRGDVMYGNPFTELGRQQNIIPGKRNAKWFSMSIQENGDVHVRGGSRNPYPGAWLEPGSPPAVHTFTVIPSGEPYAMEVISLIATENQIGTVGGAGNGPNHFIYKQESYKSGAMLSTGTPNPVDGGGEANKFGAIAVTQGMRYWLGKHNDTRGVQELTNPFASPSILTSYGEGYAVDAVRPDMQTRTTLIATSRRDGAGQITIYVFAAGTWSTMAGPEGFPPGAISSQAYEPIVRPE